MVSGIWRQIRNLLGAHEQASPAAPSQAGPPPVDRPTVAAEPEGAALPSAPPPAAESAEAPRPVGQLAEHLSERLTEDESLRSSLTDDEFQPLLDWALNRVGALAGLFGSMPPLAAAATFQQAAGQLRELLRLANLAIGERAAADSQLVANRFQMIDTLLGPPLLDESAAQMARARLEALLAQPAGSLQTADGPELARRLVEALG